MTLTYYLFQYKKRSKSTILLGKQNLHALRQTRGRNGTVLLQLMKIFTSGIFILYLDSFIANLRSRFKTYNSNTF